MARGLKAALPDGWAFVSARPATFAEHTPTVCWLATLEAKKAGDFFLLVEIDHDPARAKWNALMSKCEYEIAVGAIGTKRSVADPYALPQCCVGDKLVVPVPVDAGDKNHRFTFAPVDANRPLRGHEYRARVTDRKDEEPKFKVDNKAAKVLRLVSTGHSTFSKLRGRDGDFRHRQLVILEAAAPGKLHLRIPVEVAPADTKLTGWVETWYQTRTTQLESGGRGAIRGNEFAGPPLWSMRVGDRLALEFENGPAKDSTAAPLPLVLPIGEYVEPKEPYPHRPSNSALSWQTKP